MECEAIPLAKGVWKMMKISVSVVYHRVVRTFRRGWHTCGRQFRELFTFYWSGPGEEIKKASTSKRRHRGGVIRWFPLCHTLDDRNLAREKLAHSPPPLSSSFSAKLLIISVNGQTRPGSGVTPALTIPWRNALFIIYQRQSAGHFPPPSIPLFHLSSSSRRYDITVSNYWNLIFREQREKIFLYHHFLRNDRGIIGVVWENGWWYKDGRYKRKLLFFELTG